ncbi:MAG: glycosyltransferase family 4 protein [Candidatus Aminicenantes bacterium]|jgi:glycosyltransferase involved in cell wall biosynthesis
MKIAALLPHVEVFGGVRRYLEIGNEFSQRGHQYVLFHPEGNTPDWLEFKGVTKSFSSLREESFDVGLCSEYSVLPHFEKLNARVKFFYFVLEGHKQEREITQKDYFFLGNSEGICRRIERKHKVSCFRAPGGVNSEFFHPVERESRPDEFRILCYGRVYKKRKGVRQVIRAVEGLRRKYPRLKLVLFDSLVGEDRRDPRPMIQIRVPHEFHLDLPQNRMAWLYSQADVFVSGERRAGWSNTAAEAMSCRVPVVCTRSGTRDFAVHDQTALVVPFPLPSLLRRQIVRLIENEGLRLKLAKAGYEKIREFSWSFVVDRLEELFREKAKLK